ncbi:hypothetical protein [Microbacterium rhizomatis]|uniref:Uncharacterized protein n=1 Tax=Microbacterium rhizomatis TaxID=1631477 RepID=A0A5J5J7B3_9MICO|nr:hypothetical protein [Microbacterium rhizomatis]KAA9111339.1 hypothetical protein F6B43_07065 [Microbacterium rhizomatis]
MVTASISAAIGAIVVVAQSVQGKPTPALGGAFVVIGVAILTVAVVLNARVRRRGNQRVRR